MSQILLSFVIYRGAPRSTQGLWTTASEVCNKPFKRIDGTGGGGGGAGSAGNGGAGGAFYTSSKPRGRQKIPFAHFP